MNPMTIPERAPSTDPAIECVGLGRVFGKRVALRNISFKIGSGTILALLGSNGAGKTTLFKILAGLILPSGGKAFVLGADVTDDPLRIKASIGFVPSEERSFYWRLTGRANLEFFAALHGIHGRAGQKRIDSLFETLGLEEYGKIRFKDYSTGIKQALGIARGLLHDPPVLLLDEPTRSLSPEMASRLCANLRARAGDGKTILVASHNLNEIERIADVIAILNCGSLRAIGSLPELRRSAGLPAGSDLETVYRHFSERENRF